MSHKHDCKCNETDREESRVKKEPPSGHILKAFELFPENITLIGGLSLCDRLLWLRKQKTHVADNLFLSRALKMETDRSRGIKPYIFTSWNRFLL